MPRDTLTGSRIRQRRISAGLRQGELAAGVGISASYLNLIEHNRRRIGGKLLVDIARRLDVEPSALAEGAEAALVAVLREAAATFPGEAAETDRTDEFAGRFPGWSGLAGALFRRVDSLERTVETLTDRLTHDPQLAASLHEVLSTVTAIRSTADILADTREIEPEWRDRFLRNLNEDANRLAGSSQALVAYLDRAADASSEAAAPQEEIDAYFAAQDYRFDELERGGSSDAVLRETADGLSPAARFAVARHLDRYAADARVLSVDRLRASIDRHGVDPLAIAASVRVAPAVVLRRLATMPAAELPVGLGFVAVDAGGVLLHRRPIEGFTIPRFGAVCPLWPLFRVFSRPLALLRQTVRSEARDGGLFETFACAEPLGEVRYGDDPLLEAQMLILPTGSGAATSEEAPSVGAACRVCPRVDCAARREPSVMG